MLADLDDEAVALNSQSERYYGLNLTAARMLRALVEHGTAESALEHLQGVWQVDAETLKKDMERTIQELCDRGILQRDADESRV